jgi:CHASE1-domain containing sensor protein
MNAIDPKQKPHPTQGEIRAGLARHCLALTIVAPLAAAGWGVAQWRCQSADGLMREYFLSQAALLAQSINPDRVHSLSFTPADATNETYLRLCRQLTAAKQAMRQERVYCLAERDGVLVFGPANRSPTESGVKPGEACKLVTTDEWAKLAGGTPLCKGPWSDSRGTFITALTPMHDERTGKVLLVMGVDVDAREWNMLLARERWLPILFAVALIVVALCGISLLAWRRRLPESTKSRLRHLEAVLTAAGGAALTLVAAYLAHKQESQSREANFLRLAEAQAQKVCCAMRGIRDYEVASVAHFMECRRNATPKEFHDFVGPLLRTPTARSFQWAPTVPAGKKAEAEASARRDGIAEFSIFPTDAQGTPSPPASGSTYYPILYAEPAADKRRPAGFDLASDPLQREALEEATRSFMLTATRPFAPAEGDEQNCIAVYFPAFDAVGTWPGSTHQRI